MGTASLVLGIVALVFVVIPPFWSVWWIGLLCGIAGIVVAAIAKKNGERGMATAGLVCSIVATAIVLVVWAACIACVASVDAALKT